jgi:hypothetical protein
VFCLLFVDFCSVVVVTIRVYVCVCDILFLFVDTTGSSPQQLTRANGGKRRYMKGLKGNWAGRNFFYAIDNNQHIITVIFT